VLPQCWKIIELRVQDYHSTVTAQTSTVTVTVTGYLF
jgi:hypothetical protein